MEGRANPVLWLWSSPPHEQELTLSYMRSVVGQMLACATPLERRPYPRTPHAPHRALHRSSLRTTLHTSPHAPLPLEGP
jgi:hypothetical protein